MSYALARVGSTGLQAVFEGLAELLEFISESRSIAAGPASYCNNRTFVFETRFGMDPYLLMAGIKSQPYTEYHAGKAGPHEPDAGVSFHLETGIAGFLGSENADLIILDTVSMEIGPVHQNPRAGGGLLPFLAKNDAKGRTETHQVFLVLRYLKPILGAGYGHVFTIRQNHCHLRT